MLALVATLNEHIWIIDFVVLCILAFIAFKQQRFSSSLLTQAFVVIISGTIIKYQELVNGFVEPSAQNDVVSLWLVGFAFYDVIIVVALLGFYSSFVSRRKKVIKVGYVILSSIMFLQFTVTQYFPLLSGLNGDSYKLWIMLAFYVGVGLIDGFAVFVIYKLHGLFRLSHCLIARMYILAFAVASIIQLIGFCLKYSWHSTAFDDVYQFSLASINICTSFVVILITCLAAYQLYTNKNKEGLLWRI